jgi:hypothetical protein
MKFRKKPVVIEAIQFTEKIANNDNLIIELADWCGGGVNWAVDNNKLRRTIIISTLEGEMKAVLGDWIIMGVSGEFYPCKPDIFEDTYEEVK